MPADIFVATPNLRFIERDLGHQRTGRILQQQWVVLGTSLWDDLNDSNSEWRDVPLAGDDNPPVSDVMADRRRLGLPDYPKPPLGQPPAFLQEQEPKVREEAAQEERDARGVDERLAAALLKQLQNAVENNSRLARVNAELKAQLPAGMKHCTIVFEECPKGHGNLRAKNWVKHGCDTCRIQKQQKALQWVLDNIGAHPENVRRVAQEGLEP